MGSLRLPLVLWCGVLLGVTAFSCSTQTFPPTTQMTSPNTHHPLPTTYNSPSITTPAVSTTTRPPNGSVVIQATGDVNLDPSYLPALAEHGYGWGWSGLDGLFQSDDLSIVNLECAPSDLGSPEPKAFTFRCAVEGLDEMAAAGVEVANLGNNHSQDFGKEALIDGRQNLIEGGIAPIGGGKDATEANSPAIFDLNGWKVAVLGFGGIRPHDGWVATDEQAGMADGDNIGAMASAVQLASSVADFVIVTIHWGVELDEEPRPDDIARAHALIAAGADAILGHHSHRLQPLESVDGVPVFWSLGNFVWPEFSAAGSMTGVARAVISPEGTVEGCLIPVQIESSGHPVVGDVTSCSDLS